MRSNLLSVPLFHAKTALRTPKLARLLRNMVAVIAPVPDEECEVPHRPRAAAPDPELAVRLIFCPSLLRGGQLKSVLCQPCTTRDLPVLAAIHRRAFGPTAATRYLQANVEPGVFEEFVRSRFAKVLADARTQNNGGSVVTVARRGDQMLGFAWSTRELAAQDRPPATNDQQERPIMAGADPVRTRELLGALEQHAKSIPFAHWSKLGPDRSCSRLPPIRSSN